MGLALALSGCTIGSQRSPSDVVASLRGPNVATQAAALPYASLALEVDGHGGLLVLASQRGATTYWQFRDGATLALEDGYPVNSAGLRNELLGTRILSAEGTPPPYPWRQPGSETHYRIERQWQDAEGALHQDSARAQLSCAAPTSVDLPLTRRRLARCQETLHWAGGATTEATLWRDPEDRRLWAYAGQPWPGAPTLTWQIARPW
ncbi:YjbF family lipoprotein [Salinicola endophyticus]|nr:YjbF family lipoprotein [Salinicola endophyticus]